MEIGFIDTPERWRDVFIMSFMVAGTILFLVSAIFTIVIGVLTTRLLLRARRILKENVSPTLDNVRQTTESVRGTVTFVSETAIKPVVKVYGVAAGARRFVVVLSRFTRARPSG